jgi:hypothetical protein
MPLGPSTVHALSIYFCRHFCSNFAIVCISPFMRIVWNLELCVHLLWLLIHFAKILYFFQIYILCLFVLEFLTATCESFALFFNLSM